MHERGFAHYARRDGEASGDAHRYIIQLRVSGKVLFSGLKRKGDSLAVNGKPPFAVRLGFARGAQVSYNGQPVDVAPFTSGETARLKLGQ